VVEEIDIDKTAETRTERVTDTVRREEVTIDSEEVDRPR
jgi:stress response protein YsnF